MRSHLHIVVLYIQDDRLVEEHGVCAVWIPLHYISFTKHPLAFDETTAEREGSRTVDRDPIHPLVQRRIQFRDDVFLPGLVTRSEEILRFVQRVLQMKLGPVRKARQR
jgi:hypothetical protein